MAEENRRIREAVHRQIESERKPRISPDEIKDGPLKEVILRVMSRIRDKGNTAPESGAGARD